MNMKDTQHQNLGQSLLLRPVSKHIIRLIVIFFVSPDCFDDQYILIFLKEVIAHFEGNAIFRNSFTILNFIMIQVHVVLNFI